MGAPGVSLLAGMCVQGIRLVLGKFIQVFFLSSYVYMVVIYLSFVLGSNSTT